MAFRRTRTLDLRYLERHLTTRPHETVGVGLGVGVGVGADVGIGLGADVGMGVGMGVVVYFVA